MKLADIIDLDRYPLCDPAFQADCKARFDAEGIFVMDGFVRPDAIASIHAEGEAAADQIYAKSEQHTVYLSRPDETLPADHPRNRLVTSSKGCLTDDQIGAASPLRVLYDAPEFRAFLCAVLGEAQLYNYADPLSSINLHFAKTGQELGWHFDNSSFAITLMVQAPESGGAFEYVSAVRDADAGDMGFDRVAAILDGAVPVQSVNAQPGTLVFFRGRNSLHRVAPNAGARTRVLAVLAYNSEPGIALSPAAQQTFYGRVAEPG